jgi:hypothetical protein
MACTAAPNCDLHVSIHGMMKGIFEDVACATEQASTVDHTDKLLMHWIL